MWVLTANESVFYFVVFECIGSVCHTHRLAIRLVAAVWCFGCFILVQAYSSCLISYLATPMSTKPIINGLNDIPQTPGIEVVVDSGASVELTFFVTHSFYIYNWVQ